MDYNGKTHSIKTEQLPRTWSEILSSFSVREIRKFPLEGQALTNAAKHNTDNKRRAREMNPDNLTAYQVWTDLPDLVDDVFGSGN